METEEGFASLILLGWDPLAACEEGKYFERA